jgi:phenylalanyl-tRNA synthetase beta chain
MLVSLKWLSEYVPITLPVEALAERLTLAGVKVERILRQGHGWEGVRIAEVTEVQPHPNADRLSLVTVELDEPSRPTVVCGAPNVEVGQRVAYAGIGTSLLDGHTGEPMVLKAARIRGVESQGMICSERELGLSEAHEGILVLPPEAPVGRPLSEFLGDTIFDFEVTPNRPDLLSILGVAWEVAAQTHTRIREPERVYPETGSSLVSQRTSVTIEDRELCPRYLAGIVERVKVGPSPQWLQERLRSAGMRPINNVVDITNYVMLETGQPLHAFDFRKLGGQRIVVRRARAGELIRTLDGIDRELSSQMLVIADASKPVAIAGVMGGGDAEVGSTTTTILLEAANFNPIGIRATSGAIGLRSEASIRFEKGLHPELAAVAARRAMSLFVGLTGGRAAKGLIDAYPVKRQDTRVVVTRKRIEQVLGMDLSTTLARNVLTDLGFGCRWVPPDRYVVRAPYWRTDVTQPDDVVEELARVIGYDRIDTAPLAGAVPEPVIDPVRNLRERLRDSLVAAGMQETLSYPLTTDDVLARVTPAEAGNRPPLRLENPMSNEQAVLRTSLRGSVLQTLAANLRHAQGSVALFEAAHVFLPRSDELPDERETIVGVLAGSRPAAWDAPSPGPVDFYDAKGILEEAFERASVEVRFNPGEDFGLLRGHTAVLEAGRAQAGVLGQLHPQIAAEFEIDAPVYLFELDVERLLPGQRLQVQHQPLSRFPSVSQDIAVIVDESVSAGDIMAVIASNPLVKEVQLFDVYQGAPLAAGKRSLAFAVQFQSAEKTLTDKEVAEARGRIVRRLERELHAELRS